MLQPRTERPASGPSYRSPITTSAATWIGETTVVRAIAHALPMIKEIQEWIRLCDVAELRAARIWNGVGAFAV